MDAEDRQDPWLCSQCGTRMVQVDGKLTFTGTEYRPVRCPKCGHEDEIETGPALWKTMSDAEEPDDS